jgi:hypothetical protein
MSSLLFEALSYIERGWWVLPVHTPLIDGCSCGEPKCPVGKHPRTRRGIADASNTKDRVEFWWGHWP